jgi:hypothetical protein
MLVARNHAALQEEAVSEETRRVELVEAV